MHDYPPSKLAYFFMNTQQELIFSWIDYILVLDFGFFISFNFKDTIEGDWFFFRKTAMQKYNAKKQRHVPRG